MKSVYIVPVSIVFLILGLFMGYLAKEVYENQKPKDKTHSAWLEEIKAYQDDDFLHSFEGIQEGLTDTEKILGQKLIACIGQKKIAQEKIEELTDEVVEAENSANKSFIDRFLGSQKNKNNTPVLVGRVAPMYGSDAVDPIPMKVIDQRYRQIFPNDSFRHQQEEGFGYYEQAVTDVDDFLNKRVAKNPSMSIVDMERKKRSKFFQSLQTAVFEGRVNIFTEGSNETPLSGKFIFRSPDQFGNDWILISDEIGNTFETRTFAQSDESIWRYNSENPSVSLLSERCFWNDQYVYEYKDFFYLAQQDLLVANIYCKKQNDSDWERVGTLQFEKIGE